MFANPVQQSTNSSRLDDRIGSAEPASQAIHDSVVAAFIKCAHAFALTKEETEGLIKRFPKVFMGGDSSFYSPLENSITIGGEDPTPEDTYIEEVTHYIRDQLTRTRNSLRTPLVLTTSALSGVLDVLGIKNPAVQYFFQCQIDRLLRKEMIVQEFFAAFAVEQLLTKAPPDISNPDFLEEMIRRREIGQQRLEITRNETFEVAKEDANANYGSSVKGIAPTFRETLRWLKQFKRRAKRSPEAVEKLKAVIAKNYPIFLFPNPRSSLMGPHFQQLAIAYEAAMNYRDGGSAILEQVIVESREGELDRRLRRCMQERYTLGYTAGHSFCGTIPANKILLQRAIREPSALIYAHFIEPNPAVKNSLNFARLISAGLDPSSPEFQYRYLKIKIASLKAMLEISEYNKRLFERYGIPFAT